MKFMDEIDIKEKKVLFRFDFNVPLDSSLNITDDTRIRAVLPSINYALDEKAAVIMVSHLGRPKGKAVPEMSLAPVAKRLSRLLGKDVQFASDCIGEDARAKAAALKPGDLLLLENLRFHGEEEKNDDAFASELASLADVYIDDAFGNAHRSHASNVGITRFVPACGAGFLIKRELEYFGGAVEKPARPFVAIVGGSKVSGKLEVVANLIRKVDKIVLGGGMAFTFLKALGYSVGKSFVEDGLIGRATEVIRAVKELGVKLYLPVDCVVAEKMDPASAMRIVPVQEIPPGWMGLDIGPATVTLFNEALENAKTIVWNGPMGVFEMQPFSKGTMAMARTLASSPAVTIVGGGDTDVAIQQAGESDKITYISTGGGASLELLEGKVLPGVAALEQCGQRIS
jgi:phosphoglycerate kinase